MAGQPPVRAIACYDYEAQDGCELSFQEGDVMTVRDRSDQDWWRGELEVNGSVGYFPKHFVRLIEATEGEQGSMDDDDGVDDECCPKTKDLDAVYPIASFCSLKVSVRSAEEIFLSVPVPFAVYCIVVRSSGKEWKVKRKESELRELSMELLNRYGKPDKFSLPSNPKRLKPHHPKYVQLVNKWLQKVCSERCMEKNFEPLRQFLRPDNDITATPNAANVQRAEANRAERAECSAAYCSPRDAPTAEKPAGGEKRDTPPLPVVGGDEVISPGEQQGDGAVMPERLELEDRRRQVEKGREQVQRLQDEREQLGQELKRLQELQLDSERGSTGDLEVQFEDVEVLEKLSDDGAFGVVYSGRLWGATSVAVKKIRMDAVDGEGEAVVQHDFALEVSQMKSARHPNVAILMGVVRRPPEYWLLMELCERGSLFDVLHRRKEELSLQRRHDLLGSVAAGMAYLHARHVVHRDLKSANVLLTQDWTPKISDFGCSKTRRHAKSMVRTGLVGTVAWMAPEVMNPRAGGYDDSCDVFSFGILCWEVFEQSIPFEKLEELEIMYAIGVNRERPLFDRTPHRYRDLIARCWAHDGARRPKFTSILREWRALIESP